MTRPRKSKGYHSTVTKNGKRGYLARLRVLNPDGSIRATYSAQARTKSAAAEALAKLKITYLERGEEAIDARGMLFSVLTEKFKEERLIDALFVGEQKVAGYKQKDRMASRINRLNRYFGHWPIETIDHNAVYAYKIHLIKTPTQRKDSGGNPKPRSIFDVHHQLRTLRILLNYAKAKRWILFTPFDSDIKLINPSHEIPRFRPEAEGELEKLLAECVDDRRHIRPWIVTAVETALRPGEIDRLTRGDILFDEGVIIARASTTKSNRRREVPITETLEIELCAWFTFLDDNPAWREWIGDAPDAKVFGEIKSNVRAFRTACRRAGIENLQRKDLRKWGTRRLVDALRAANLPELDGMVVTGHTRIGTYQWYLDTDRRKILEIGKALNKAKK